MEAPHSLSRAVEAIAGTAGLARIARQGAVEALAIEGLRPDQIRIAERSLARGSGAELIAASDASCAVLVGPVSALAGLAQQLVQWGPPTEDLGSTLAATLTGRHHHHPLRCGPHALEVGRKTLVMGVLNVTPDSFSGDGLAGDVPAAVDRAEQMVAEGADIIDVGGESTRPHSQPVDASTELARVLPVLRALASRLTVPISIDTRKAEVATAAIDVGASMVNDIWGLRGDPGMGALLAAHPEVALVAMHNRRGTDYRDLVADVARDLRESLLAAARQGIDDGRIVVDPGFGFGKRPAQNLELLDRLVELRGIGRPLLIGPSRKSTIGLLLGGAPPELRLEGTLALCVIAVAAGAAMVRVHDVAALRRGLTVADAVLREIPGTPPVPRDERADLHRLGLAGPRLQPRPPWPGPGMPARGPRRQRSSPRGGVERDPHAPGGGHLPG
jgi:dihydropteroate synthase